MPSLPWDHNVGMVARNHLNVALHATRDLDKTQKQVHEDFRFRELLMLNEVLL